MLLVFISASLLIFKRPPRRCLFPCRDRRSNPERSGRTIMLSHFRLWPARRFGQVYLPFPTVTHYPFVYAKSEALSLLDFTSCLLVRAATRVLALSS